MAGLKGQALPEGQLSRLPALLPHSLFAAAIPVVGGARRISGHSGSGCLASVSPLVVNLWGHLGGGFGLGEGALCTARALGAAGLTVQLRDLPLASHPGAAPIQAAAKPILPAAIDLLHTNPNVLRQTDGLAAQLQLEAPLRIGYWAWELEAFPDGWEAGFSGLDQLWCPSPFCATALGQRSPVPVTALPHLIDWRRADRLAQQRADLGRSGVAGRRLPFTVLFAFDFWSTRARKNPDGVIEAFLAAFPPGGSVAARLVLKLGSAGQFPEATAELAERCAGDPRLQLITSHLSADEFDALYVQADVVLSLHRAEGFGLLLAEAMAAGIPTVASGYGGNLCFMPPGSAELVPCRRVPIQRTEGDYRAGWCWGEPDLDGAAAALRRLADHPAQAAQLAAAGRRAVREALDPAGLAAVVAERIGSLLRWGGRAELLAALPLQHSLRQLQ